MSSTAVGDHLSDVKTLRENARAHIEQGPFTEDYGADRERVIKVLNEALATELVCVLRYKRHYYMADGINSASGGCGVPAARDRGAGPCRLDRRSNHAAAGRARLQSGDTRRPQPRRVRGGHRPDRHDQGRSRGRAGRHRFVQRDRALARRRRHHHPSVDGAASSPSRKSTPTTC